MIFSTFEISNDYGKLLEQGTTMPNFWKKIRNNYRDFKIADYPNFYCVAYKKNGCKNRINLKRALAMTGC